MRQEVELSYDRVREVIDYDPETGSLLRRKFAGKDEPLSHARALEVLDYEPTTGVFRWKAKTGRKTVIGEEAGSLKATQAGIYRYVRVDGTAYLAQRLAWFYVHGRWPLIARFKDGDTLNCAIDNLADPDGQLEPYVDSQGHLRIKIDSVTFQCSRLAWFWVHGKWPRRLRYLDGDPKNIRIGNLAEPLGSEQTRYDARKSHYDDNRDRARDLAFQAKYGISLAEYQRLAEEQNHKCFICGDPETIERNGKPRMLAVDHCHDTGKVRGLLCGRCNPMIGYADHNVDILTRAIDYLKRTNGGTS